MKQALVMASLAAAVGLGGLQGCSSMGGPDRAQTMREKVVIQVSEGDPKVWNLALNNAENVQEALGQDKVTVEIVAYGPGLKMLTSDSKVAGRVNGALDRNVKLMACATTMKKMNVTEADLVGGVKVVPGGVIEIMERQAEGWSYVRP